MARLLKQWSNVTSEYIENQEISNFIQDVIDVYKKHGFSLSHEDTYGSFLVE